MESDDDMELLHGSGNIYRDFGEPDADVRQLKALLAAEVLKIIDERKLTVRAAKAETGIAASDFSHIRHAKLGRFTVDRLMTILGRLDREVEVSVSVRAKPARSGAAALAPVPA